MHGVDGNEPQAKIFFEVLVGRDVAASALEAHLHVELAAFGDSRNVNVLVEDLDVAISLDHAGGHNARLVRLQVDRLRSVTIELERDLLQVQDDVGGVFDHSADGLELVQHALDLHGGNRRAFDRAQEHATQRVAHGGAESALDGLRPEASVFIGESLGIGSETFRFLKTLPKCHCVSPSGRLAQAESRMPVRDVASARLIWRGTWATTISI